MKKTGSAQGSAAEPLERVRLQADVAKQRVRIAKDELKRARKRLKEAKREARRARKLAAVARKAWKRARRAQKGNSKKASVRKLSPSPRIAVARQASLGTRRKAARRRSSSAVRRV